MDKLDLYIFIKVKTAPWEAANYHLPLEEDIQAQFD